MKYKEATAATMELVGRLAEQHHRRLDGAKIAVVMKEKAGKKNGKTVLATAMKPPDKMQPLLKSKYHFVIVIAEDEWQKATPEKKAALVDHELCHCEIDADGEPGIRGHDLEEFAEIITRHGFWRQDYGEHNIQLALADQGIEIGTLTGLGQDTKKGSGHVDSAEEDHLSECVAIIKETGRAATGMIQRRLRIGYTRAARYMDILEERGIIGPARGSTPRAIFIDTLEQAATT